MSIQSIKITSLTNIAGNISYTSIIPLVDMNGTPITKKANLQILGNLILNGAGGSYFASAAQAINAQTVSNAAQPAITSVGTLTSLTVSGVSNLGPVGNVIISGGSSGQVLSTNGNGTLSWTSGGNGTSGFSGWSGISGFSGTGTSGFSGYSGGAGATGPAGTGTSGFSGWSGISGFSGQQGLTGATGIQGPANGATGISGFSGLNGTQGTSGFSGWSGISGFSGNGGVNTTEIIISTGTTQANAALITKDVVEIYATASLDNNTGVRLPVSVPGEVIYLMNNTDYDVKVYPATAEAIQQLPANQPYIHRAKENLQYVATNIDAGVYWEVFGNTFNSTAVIISTGTTQANAAPITKDVVEIYATASLDNNTGVRLPVSVPGEVIYLMNNTDFDVKVYPATAEAIQQLPANQPYIHKSKVNLQYVATNIDAGVYWEVFGNTFNSTAAITSTGTIQANAAPIIKDVVEIYATASLNNNTGVRLPVSVPGEVIYLMNNTDYDVKVYPALNESIEQLSANQPYIHRAKENLQYVATNIDAGVYWEVFGKVVNTTIDITTAGTTQANATPITKDINFVSSVGNINQGVRLPVSPLGTIIYIINGTATNMKVYPPDGEAINNLTANESYIQDANNTVQYISATASRWFTMSSSM